jgi:hypothetical protein
VGTVPPASNRATADWVIPARSASWAAGLDGGLVRRGGLRQALRSRRSSRRVPIRRGAPPTPGGKEVSVCHPALGCHGVIGWVGCCGG